MEVNLNKLRQLCEKNKNFEEIKKIIDSLPDRQDYARYHYHEFKKLSDEKSSLAEAIMLAISTNQNYRDYRVAMKAHIIACIQNMHIIQDLLGFLIFNVLDLKIVDKKGKRINNIYLYVVVDHLESLNDARYEILLKLLFQFVNKNNKDHSYFKYLSALVNHSKHKYTIEPKFNTKLVGDIERTCYFDEFTHNHKIYKKIDAMFLINTEYNREAKLILQIENELIAILEKRLSSI